ncbi:MAG: hypothetical protein V9F04_09135 [Dermatophilaceae bacterium]
MPSVVSVVEVGADVDVGADVALPALPEGSSGLTAAGVEADAVVAGVGSAAAAPVPEHRDRVTRTIPMKAPAARRRARRRLR